MRLYLVPFGANCEPCLAELQHVVSTATAFLCVRLPEHGEPEHHHQHESSHCGIPQLT